MPNFNLKALLIFIPGFLFFEVFNNSDSKSNAQIISEKNQLETKTVISKNNYSTLEFKYPRISFQRNKFSNILTADLKNKNKFLFSLIAENNLQENQERSIEIEADIQYEKDNKFYAEGNVVILFSNGKLIGDKAIYDSQSKNFEITGNVNFIAGSQYISANKFIYSIADESGYIDDAYGVLDIEDFDKDLNLDSSLNEPKDFSKQIKSQNINNLEYINTASLGLVNDFEENRKLNITELKFEIPSVTRWRFKSQRINIKDKMIFSDQIYFTNDVFNKPQFILLSKKFKGEIFKDKLKLVSRNSWIILDEKIKLPIGRRAILDKDPITKWGIGSDYEDLDGFYLSRGFGAIDIFEDYSLKIRPYLLIQRAFKGKNESFRDSNASILSDKVELDNSFLDLFALDTEITKDFNEWSLLIKSDFHSLNPNRINQSNRSKLILTKSINLNQISADEGNEKASFNDVIDLKIYGSYREIVSKGFDGEEEIYFAKGASIANKKTWVFGEVNSNLAIIYDLGEFTAERKKLKELDTLFRNFVAIKYKYEFPLWRKQNLDKVINSKYRYTPKVIKQGVTWKSALNAGKFFYSNNSSQEAITFSTGPKIELGSFNNLFFDYTNLDINLKYITKKGASPFLFDDINKTARIAFNVEQQIIGPLLFRYNSYLKLDGGGFAKPEYGLDIRRRAYSVGLFYDSSNKSAGFKFNIFNFDYDGISPKF